jgi:putative glutamine amidotransferase
MNKSKRFQDERPLVGISMRLEPAQQKFYLQTNYSEAIEAAGGAPTLVPLIPEKSFIRNLVDTFDALVLSGSGSDVDPRRYGARKHPQCDEIHPARDETDLLLLEEAFRRRIPVLAICFGIQSLNVFLGGTLVQDIPSQWPHAIDHSLSKAKPTKKNPENFCAHPISVEHNSLLFDLAGKKKNVRVNSSHHQAIDDLGHDLAITARASDGIIEGVELKSDRHFVLGTQWHPEKGFERDPLSQAIFRRFVNEAKKRALGGIGRHPRQDASP